jgi:flagellar biosynthesis chaperone FliJ
MKKLLIMVLLLMVLAGGCGPSFCDESSPDYDRQRCQRYSDNMSEGLQQVQTLQMQQQIQQNTLQLQRQQNQLRLQQQSMQNMQRLHP